jgi:yeast amino acid transporter
MADFKTATADEAYSSSSPTGIEDRRGDHDAIDPNSGVKRGLKTRHLSMLALAGIVSQDLSRAKSQRQ